MKLNICLALLLIPFWGNSQTKKSSYVFFETGVTRLESSPTTLSSYVDHYNIPKDLFNMVVLPKNSSNSIFRNDTLVSQYNSYNSISPGSTDFRTISIGYGRTIQNKKKMRIDHAVGLHYSIADFSLRTLAGNLIEKQNISIDSNGNDKTTYITLSNTVTGYGKMRSAGITYQNTLTANNILKRLDFSCAIRQNLLVKFEDKLMLFQTETNDTFNYSPNNYLDESCGGVGPGVLLKDINFYTKELPPSTNYKTYKGKMGLQYQMTILVRMSLNLGKKYGTKLYTQFGVSPFTFYGNQFKGGSTLIYGMGVLQDLNF